MDERKLTIIRGDMPDDTWSHNFLLIHKYWFRKVHKSVIFDIQYIVGGFKFNK